MQIRAVVFEKNLKMFILSSDLFQYFVPHGFT